MKYLDLSGNFIETILPPDPERFVHHQLDILLLSQLPIIILDMDLLETFSNISQINISHGHFTTITSFKTFSKLEMITMVGSVVEHFPKDLFQGLVYLKYLDVANDKFCCSQLLPGHMRLKDCESPRDELSSCENLVRSDFYRIFLWVFMFLATAGK